MDNAQQILTRWTKTFSIQKADNWRSVLFYIPGMILYLNSAYSVPSFL